MTPARLRQVGLALLALGALLAAWAAILATDDALPDPRAYDPGRFGRGGEAAP